MHNVRVRDLFVLTDDEQIVVQAAVYVALARAESYETALTAIAEVDNPIAVDLLPDLSAEQAQALYIAHMLATWVSPQIADAPAQLT